MNLFFAASTAFVLGVVAAACSAAPEETAEGSTADALQDCGHEFAKDPDGCSSWSDNPAQVRDKWGSADFRPSCNDHDRCYYTLGSNVDACNDNFCKGLEKACRHAYCKKLAGNWICEPATYSTCMGVAASYCAAVRATAAGVYHKAQGVQREYEARCKSGLGMEFSMAGPLPGKHCVSLNEPSDPDTWGDNYLCFDQPVDVRFSVAGPIPGYDCTRIEEPSEPAEHTWGDNYLCVNPAERLRFGYTYSQGGMPISGQRCVTLNEASDPHTWGDNVLCVSRP